MTNEQATAQEKKRWGKQFFVRNGESFSSVEKRDKNRDQYRAATKEIADIEAEIKRRLSELDWYQELRERQRKLRSEANVAQGNALYYRFSVGRRTSTFNEILGQGDTWEEAFAKADDRDKKDGRDSGETR